MITMMSGNHLSPHKIITMLLTIFLMLSITSPCLIWLINGSLNLFKKYFSVWDHFFIPSFIFNLLFKIIFYLTFLYSYSGVRVFCNYYQFFYWSIVDLHCCISFRCIAKWFSYIYICMYVFFLRFFLLCILSQILFHYRLL